MPYILLENGDTIQLEDGSDVLVREEYSAGGALLVNDPFTRSTGGNWGTEPVSGLSYVHQNSNSTFSTTGTKGQLSLAAAAASGGANLAISVLNTRVTATLRSSEIANGKSGAINLGRLSARQNSTTPTDRYTGRLEFRHATNALDLIISRRAGGSESDVASALGFGLGQTTTNDYFLELTVTGTTSVVVELRVWRDDGSRPSSPSVTYTDNSPNTNLQSAGGVGWAGWINSPHAGPYPVLLQVDDLKVEDLDAVGGPTTVDGSFTSDAILRKLDNAATFTSNAVLRRTESATFTSNAILLRTETVALTSNAVLRRTEDRTFTSNAVLGRTESATFIANALLTSSAQVTFTANAILRKLDNLGSFTSNAIIRRTEDATYTADAVILVPIVYVPIWTTPADTEPIDQTQTFAFLSYASTNPQHFQMQFDKSNTFDSVFVELFDSNVAEEGWEYYNGTSWVALPGTGLPPQFSGNEVRFTVTLSSRGRWYRRVRAGE
jgi:hypothetical protein